MIKKACKRSVVIEYIQYDGSNYDEIVAWIDGVQGQFTPAYAHARALTIETLEGEMTVSPDDYVIKGIQNEFYPCKPDIFAASYDLVPS